LISRNSSSQITNLYFELSASTVSTSPGTITPAEFTALENDQVLFSGATEVYNEADFDLALESLIDNQAQFILSDLYGGVDGKNAKAAKVFNFNRDEANFKKIIIIGGGNVETQFDVVPTGSVQIAQYYNSERVVVVHGGVQVQKYDGYPIKRDSFYHSVFVLGLLSGLTPQTPATNKPINITGLQHDMKQKERVKALKYGVLHTIFNENDSIFVINQAINTLQKNDRLINVLGMSYEISIMRILDQLIKELKIEATRKFVGGNLFTASEEDIKTFTEGFLLKRTITGSTDGLLKKFQKITVRLFEDSWFVNYEVQVNSPINKLFFTGTILSNNTI